MCVVLWLGICVEVDVDIIIIFSSLPPSLSSLASVTGSYWGVRGVKWIRWEQTCRWTLNRAKTSFFSGVKTRLMWSPPSTWLNIRELAEAKGKRRVQRCLFANRLRFSELFNDILLMLNVRRLYKFLSWSVCLSAVKLGFVFHFAWRRHVHETTDSKSWYYPGGWWKACKGGCWYIKHIECWYIKHDHRYENGWLKKH